MAIVMRNGNGVGRQASEGFLPLSQAMNRLLQDSFLLPSAAGHFGPFGAASGTNLWETNDGFVVQVAVPGVPADAVQLTVEQNVLTVKGESATKAPENAKPIWQALGGQTEFRVQIPGEVDSASAEASYADGILTVNLPKAQHIRARTIQVTAK